MKKLCFVAALLFVFVSGCIQGHIVRVNGFLEAGASIRDKAAVYVAADPNSHNPIFTKEIKGKIERLLSDRGYSALDEENMADYRLAFAFGVTPRQVSGFQHYYGPGWFTYDGHGRHYYGWFGTYVPYSETYHDQWLTMRLSDTGRQEAALKGTVIWVGEAVSSEYRADLRQTINYLLAAIFEYFGEDTKRQTALRIRQNDPRLTPIID